VLTAKFDCRMDEDERAMLKDLAQLLERKESDTLRQLIRAAHKEMFWNGEAADNTASGAMVRAMPYRVVARGAGKHTKRVKERQGAC